MQRQQRRAGRAVHAVGSTLQVLGNAETREKYDKHGSDALDMNFMVSSCGRAFGGRLHAVFAVPVLAVLAVLAVAVQT